MWRTDDSTLHWRGGGRGRQQQKHELQTRHFTARCGALTGGGLGGGDPSEGRDLSPQAFKVSAFSMKHEVRKPPTWWNATSGKKGKIKTGSKLGNGKTGRRSGTVEVNEAWKNVEVRERGGRGRKTRRNRGTNLSWRHVGSLTNRLGVRMSNRKRNKKKDQRRRKEKTYVRRERQDYQAVNRLAKEFSREESENKYENSNGVGGFWRLH